MQQRFLLQILLLAQHVFKLLVWYGAEGYVSGLRDAAKAANRTHNL